MTTLDDTMIQEGGSGLELQSGAIEYLREIRKWAKFLSIVGFIGIGFMLLAGIVVSISFSQFDTSDLGSPFPTSLLGLIYVVMAAIYFFPVLYLFRFSQRMKVALNTNNSEALKQSFMNLKSHYKFMGIMMIVMFALYFVGIIVFLIIGVNSFTSF